MAKLNRFTMPVFAGNAAQSQTSVFGTMKISPQYTTDVAASIGTTAYGNGWSDAIEIGYAPYMEDMNTLQRAITYQISYNQQQGIPEWASDTEYYKGSVAKLNTANGMQIYSSLVDNNVGNLVSDNTKWKLLIDSANNYVTTNTAQTISETKTFASRIVSKEGGTYANYATGNQIYMNIDAYDSTNKLTGIVDNYTDTNGLTQTRIISYYPNDTSKYSFIGAMVDANGNASTYAPTPASNSNDNNIATTAWVNTVGNNVVHLAGSETITGNKTVLDAIEKKATWDSTQTPSTLVVSDAIRFKDSNDVLYGLVTSTKNIDGVLSTVIDCRKGNLFSQVRVCIDNNNNIFATAPDSDKVNSIVTTEGISKGANGYVRFGNGIIIQWGDGYSNPVTFPTPFSSIAVVTGSPTYNGRTQDGHGYVWNVTTTSFEYRCDNDMLPYQWIAIGY